MLGCVKKTILKNNFYLGKLAENPVRTESKLFETLDHVSQSEYMSEQGYEVKGIKDWDDGRTLITRSSKTESVKTKQFTSIIIGRSIPINIFKKLYF